MIPKRIVSGYIRDAAHKRTQTDVRAHLARFGSQTLPNIFSLRSFAAPTMDQGDDGTCGGHSGAQATATATNSQGVPLGFVPSPGGIYTDTRCLPAERTPNADGTLPPLTDSGVMIADIATAVSRYGVRPIKAPTPDGRYSDVWSDADTQGIANAPPANINLEPSETDLAAQAVKLMVGEYRIDETSSELVTLVRQTLAIAKVPVEVGVFVDSQVMNFTAGSAPVGPGNTSDPNGGGHAIVIDGYAILPDGTFAFDVHNSWGSSYGKAGGFDGNEAWLRSCSDVYAWTVRAA